MGVIWLTTLLIPLSIIKGIKSVHDACKRVNLLSDFSKQLWNRMTNCRERK